MHPFPYASQEDAKKNPPSHPLAPIYHSIAPLSRLSVLRLADSTDWSILVLGELLREELLPDLEPLLMLGGGKLAWLLEGAGEKLAETGTENLHDEHCLPVGEGETATVAVEDDHAGVHLKV